MTRKDYEKIAKALYDSRPEMLLDTLDYETRQQQWDNTLFYVTGAMGDNPRFDGTRFQHYAKHGCYASRWRRARLTHEG